MSVIISNLQRLDSFNWRLSWESDQINPLFKIYQDGLLIDTTSATSRDFSVSPGESLVVEILDSDDDQPMQAFPGRFLLGWYPSPKTAHYRIERQIAGVWRTKTTINDTGRGFYTWKTDFLEDQTEHKYRIVPIGTNGNQGDPVVMSELMVRHPSPPAQNFSYNPTTREVTINA